MEKMSGHAPFAWSPSAKTKNLFLTPTTALYACAFARAAKKANNMNAETYFNLMPQILKSVQASLPKFREHCARPKAKLSAMDVFVGPVLDRIWFNHKTKQFWIEVKMPKPSKHNRDSGFGTTYCENTVAVKIPLPDFLITQ